ncbi:dihydrofolate reductase family protein [Amphibacillus jilinensis]|uniref:dihydrofolate reductase family protein n=1 Tax=Amphibacillus jilinensis TaxID=1216008 RepID=UPI0002DF52E1|nr:dihydrofolate reductase family protein [Amphibacillus jilinensis]
MAKLIAQLVLSLDGYYGGMNGEVDWHLIDDDYNRYATKLLQGAQGLMMGRRTFELMEQFWPTHEAMESSPEVAKEMNRLPKYIFSQTLTETSWAQTQLIADPIVVSVEQLKQQLDGDLVILGSGQLVHLLTKHRLIDEYQIMINPVLIGAGKSAFQGMLTTVSLNLLESNTFSSGNVLLRYQLNKQ